MWLPRTVGVVVARGCALCHRMVPPGKRHGYHQQRPLTHEAADRSHDLPWLSQVLEGVLGMHDVEEGQHSPTLGARLEAFDVAPKDSLLHGGRTSSIDDPVAAATDQMLGLAKSDSNVKDVAIGGVRQGCVEALGAVGEAAGPARHKVKVRVRYCPRARGLWN